MTKQTIGLNTTLYVFSLSEHENFLKYKAKFKGFYTERFINNAWAIEVRKITY